MPDALSKYPSADEAPVLDEVAIPEPGTSDARAARWLGFRHNCECHVLDNNGEDPVKCEAHIVNHSGQQPDACGHVISPDCALHNDWTPGDTALIVRRIGAFASDDDVAPAAD